MDFIKSLILVGLVLTFFFGQLFRLNFGNIAFPAIDIFIVLFTLLNLFEHRQQLKPQNKYFSWFILFSAISLMINIVYFRYPFLKPLFYFIRLTSLLSLLIYPPQINQKIKYLFVLSLTANIIFGLIQYYVWPDFTFFNSLNWDPHLSRLVSTYFDPTFTGLIYLMFLLFVFINKKYFLPITYYGLLVTTYLGLALTYSRSSLLSLFVVSIFFALKLKHKKIFYITSLVLILTILILPRPPGEGTKLERTSSIMAKIVNYEEGFKTFATSPLIGHGYNNLFYVRNTTNVNSHANSGFDGSLMTILTTTGIIGLSLFVLGLNQLYIQSNLLKQSLLIVILVHSLFANSLLYPWTLIFFVLI